MKYLMATMVLALAACGGQGKTRPPPNLGANEPVSTTTTTSAALTIEESRPVTVENAGEAPIVAAKETDRNLAMSIRSHLGRDHALSTVPWQRVSMEVEDEHVTLRGNLPTLADSTEVERAVRAVKGVRAVKNEIRTNDAYRH